MNVIDAPRIPREQKFWLVIHWIAVLQPVHLLVQGTIGGLPASQMAVVVIATIATLIAVYCATRLARRHLPTDRFIKWTTTGRVIAVGWTFIGLVLFVIPVVSVLANVDLTGDTWTSGFLGAVGSVSFLAMIGPGYSDFREALAHVDASASAVTDAVP